MAHVFRLWLLEMVPFRDRKDKNARILVEGGDAVYDGHAPVDQHCRQVRRGFGSVVIELSLRHELKGSGVLTFHPDSVGCILTIPATYIVATETQESIPA